ncbi:hypothetical protein THAOC_15392 [Thalassiosira oceanica]|uniref:Uncharacterized protein n=1 Tax=Thalassiosira oceanica TaxID=159749 RepID=K0SFY8_THAOC|nr:hypothetical protein THAOC_15392 [Thalassiosira oceanica]|eukprot:EJK63924.1 hypothetical protein THAOC_15392 [Thalassiosira oceanica]
MSDGGWNLQEKSFLLISLFKTNDNLMTREFSENRDEIWKAEEQENPLQPRNEWIQWPITELLCPQDAVKGVKFDPNAKILIPNSDQHDDDVSVWDGMGPAWDEEGIELHGSGKQTPKGFRKPRTDPMDPSACRGHSAGQDRPRRRPEHRSRV